MAAQILAIISANLIEAQERHKKSPKKRTSTQARCGSLGGLLIHSQMPIHGLLNNFQSVAVNAQISEENFSNSEMKHSYSE